MNLTQTEYKLLLDAMFLADRILAAHYGDEYSEDDPYQMLFQKLYSHAGEMGCGELVETVKDENRYAPSRKFEEESGAWDLIGEYDDTMFWEELIARLAERDVYASIAEDEAGKMSEEDLWQRAAPYDRKYAREVERHGIERLIVNEKLSSSGG